MKYYSRKGFVVITIFFFVVIMTVISFYAQVYAASCILVTAMIYLIWMWYDTYYTICGNQLSYKSALLKGSIEISSIVEIVNNKKLFSGKKPSLSTKGIIIKYNKYDDIFVSPNDIDKFIEGLKTINPNIELLVE